MPTSDSQSPRVEDLEELIKSGRLSDAAAAVQTVHASDAAKTLTQLPKSMRGDVLLSLPTNAAADIMEHLPDDVRARVLEEMDPKHAASILREMDWDEEVDLLQDVDPEQAEAIIELLKEEEPELRTLMSYDEDTAGGLMTKEFIAISDKMTARETIRSLRERADEYVEIPYTYLYATDDLGRLTGVISYRSLVLTGPDTPILSIAEKNAISVSTSTKASELTDIFKKYRFFALPVVDSERRLLGVVAHSDVLEFEREEAEEELLQVSGILRGEELRDMPLFVRSSRRLAWLCLKIVLNLITASVIALHQPTIAAFAALAVLLPVISDLGGSAGGQAAAVSIRELGLDRVRPRDLLKVWMKELGVGFLNGICLGLILGFLGWLYERHMGGAGNAFGYGALAAFSVAVNTLIAVTIGGLGPLVLKRFGFDPAIAAIPILTTFTDFCGFFLVLGLAPMFIRYNAA